MRVNVRDVTAQKAANQRTPRLALQYTVSLLSQATKHEQCQLLPTKTLKSLRFDMNAPKEHAASSAQAQLIPLEGNTQSM